MTDETVLLVTASYDQAAELVAERLARRGRASFRLDTDKFPSAISARFTPSTGVEFQTDAECVSAHDIRSVWYRRNVAPRLPALDQGTQEFCERETRAFLTGCLAALPTNRWLSRIDAIALAERKPYQLYIASRLGFPVPDTVMGNDPESMRALASTQPVVAKALSSGYIRGSEGNRAIFTSMVQDFDLRHLDEELRLAPVTFQGLVDKTSDIRVTVVGNKVFAAEILSQSDDSSRLDWRATDDPHLAHHRHELPSGVADLCVSLVRELGLSFGAIDLALIRHDEYVFFEINPNGEWLWIEERLGFPIADEIAEWLDRD